ncbi:hypothetical protein [Kitasatospora sp. NPDC004272]
MRFPKAVRFLVGLLAYLLGAAVLLALLGRTDPNTTLGTTLRAAGGGLLAARAIALLRRRTRPGPRQDD